MSNGPWPGPSMSPWVDRRRERGTRFSGLGLARRMHLLCVMRKSISIGALNEDGGLSFADADRTVHDPRALVRWSTILEMLPAEQQCIRASVASMSANEFRLWLAAMGGLCLPKAIERFRQTRNT
jgi:hypothetical protein